MTFWAEGGGGRERRLQLISPTLAGVPCMERVCTSPAKGVRSRNKYAQVVSPRKYVARHSHRKTRVVPITCHLWDRYCIAHMAIRWPTTRASLATYLHNQTPHMFLNILLLLTVHYHPKVFLNTTPTNLGPRTINFSSFPVLETAVSMDVFKQQCSPVENPLSIPMALTHHHYSEQTMQTSVHFSYLRGMEQLKEKQEKFYAARQQRIQLQEAKLNKVNHLPKCCER